MRYGIVTLATAAEHKGSVALLEHAHTFFYFLYSSYVAADFSKAGLGFMLDGKSAFDGNTFDAEGAFGSFAPPYLSGAFVSAYGTVYSVLLEHHANGCGTV